MRNLVQISNHHGRKGIGKYDFNLLPQKMPKATPKLFANISVREKILSATKFCPNSIPTPKGNIKSAPTKATL
jgi:hypothetical protein